MSGLRAGTVSLVAARLLEPSTSRLVLRQCRTDHSSYVVAAEANWTQFSDLQPNA
jgi:hypothetical protein